MKLVSASIDRFRNIVDSSPIDVDSAVTCLVGKNESGKTAFLQALYRLNPVFPAPLVPLDDFPRWMLTKARRAGEIEDVKPVTARFDIGEGERSELEARFGVGAISSGSFVATRSYSGTLSVIPLESPVVDEGVLVEHLVSAAQLGPTTAPHFRNLRSIDALRQAVVDAHSRVAAAADESADVPDESDVQRLEAAIAEAVGDATPDEAVCQWVSAHLPTFFYFSDYDFLAGRTNLDNLFKTPPEKLRAGDRVALALLKLAGADDSTLIDEDYENRKAELEAVSNDLTREIARYWSQGAHLEVEIDVDKQIEPDAQGNQRVVARHLDVRVKDRRHGHTDNFDKRSNGFRWFFSFLAQFSEFEDRDESVIILLDEPALTLHATAQRDFLRFIEERLAPKHQVLYTTHSPFMVDVKQLHRARLVEDKGDDTGAKVTGDVMTTDRDTLFPLQAALGYDIAQSLFLGPHNLVVEGTSDFTYLQVLSEHLKACGREGLDERWTMVPAGGVTKVCTFVALLGSHLDVTVLIDAGKEAREVKETTRRKLASSVRVLTPGDVLNLAEADIEDLFHVDDYLRLYNAAYGKELTSANLIGADRVVARIARAAGESFNHGAPAQVLLRDSANQLNGMTEQTLDNFETLFRDINKSGSFSPRRTDEP